MDAPSLVTLDGAWQMVNGLSTPLHVAVAHASNPAVVAALVNAGADPNSRDAWGETPLFRALDARFRRGNLPAIGQLLNAGADPNARSKAGLWEATPLHRAAKRGLLEAATALLDGGADPDAGPRTPLHDAAFRQRTMLTSLLLARGADPNARDQLGRTPLSTALAPLAPGTVDPQVIEILLDGGANARLRDHEGVTPWDLAVDAQNSAARRSFGGLTRRGLTDGRRGPPGRSHFFGASWQPGLNPPDGVSDRTRRNRIALGRSWSVCR